MAQEPGSAFFGISVVHDESPTQDDHEDIGKVFLAPFLDSETPVTSEVYDGNTGTDRAKNSPVKMTKKPQKFDPLSTEKREFLQKLVIQ